MASNEPEIRRMKAAVVYMDEAKMYIGFARDGLTDPHYRSMLKRVMAHAERVSDSLCTALEANDAQ